MAELRVRVLDSYYEGQEVLWWDGHGHALPHGVEVIIFYRDGCINNGTTRTNEPPQFGCICPWDGTDPNCPIPFVDFDEYADA